MTNADGGSVPRQKEQTKAAAKRMNMDLDSTLSLKGPMHVAGC
jgi:hypothetical protein